MNDFLAEILELLESGEQLDHELLELIDQLLQSEENLEVPLVPGADLLWILSGENPQAFTQYLNNFPDPALNALARNPTALQQTIARLSQQITQPAGEVQDGVAKQPLNSSNIYGFQYDPRSGKLKVRFNSGSVYTYDGVPPNIFKMFQQGAVPARTNGQNKWGKWWVGKKPSSGASFYQLIRDRFPYRKVA